MAENIRLENGRSVMIRGFKSYTCPWFDDEFTAGETRAARNEEGKTYQVPAELKYQDWKDCFVNHTKDPAEFLKPTKVERTQVADKVFANPSNSDILKMKTGVRIIAPYSKPVMEHASRYYGLVRKMSTDVKKIAKNTGFSIEEISRIKSFIFLEKHDLGDGKYEFFAPDFAMAESWQRLIEGNPEKHDFPLLQHEIMENRLMHEGLSQEKAHLEASKKYNYSKESDQFYALLEKHSNK